MDFNDTPKQAEFRAKCRDWLDANANIKDESKPKSISWTKLRTSHQN